MLEIKKIKKVYVTEDLKQTALNEVSINFRKCEFACILGPSGSGKTTLLNIIGGLDKYDSGDLIINEVSTKKYNDRDWDSYRNHRIGFVFQNYNLISHQTILNNVELALTLSGVSPSERKRRAKKALEDVGLKEHINKKPNQLSGGQMQRVAIARALVNNPDILLADEPTGALDSETSVQIMKLLKNVSKDKLVIMVTHNPDLANEYSTRIVNLKDGKIVNDTNPYDGKVNTKETEEKSINKSSKTRMSFKTALGLSFNNLMVKKKRTLLISFASSIGIIGIALILSVATGFQKYIDNIQEETLSSYPLMITKESADMTSLLLSMVSNDSSSNNDSGKVTEKQYISSVFSNITSNDLKSFNNYIKTNHNEIKSDISSIKYSYNITPNIYTIDATDTLAKLNPSSLSSTFYSSSVSSLTSSFSSIFSQMLDDSTMLNEKYDVLAGSWPTEYDEMIIVLSEPNTISDLLVYSLGLRDTKELNKIITKVMAGEESNITNEPMTFTYDDLLNIKLKLIKQTDIYKYNENYNIYEDMSENDEYMKKLYDSATPLKIVGIVAPKSGSSSLALTPGVNYTSKLIDYITSEASETDIVKKQLNNKDIDVISNKRFDDETSENSLNFEDLISIDTDKIKEAFNVDISEDDIKNMTTGYMNKISNSITTDTTSAKNSFNNALETLLKGVINDYIDNPKETIPSPMDINVTIPIMHLNNVDEIVNNYIGKNSELLSTLESSFVVPSSVFETTYKSLIKGMLEMYIKTYYASDTSLTEDSDNPAAIINNAGIDTLVSNFMNSAPVILTSEKMSSAMTEAVMKKTILTDVGNLTSNLITSFSSAFNVDTSTLASTFKFELNDEELQRIMTAMMSSGTSKNSSTVLSSLGYQDKEDPFAISFYFKSFDSKTNFLNFIKEYNDMVDDDAKKINYTDTTGILMSSVKTVVDSISYVLIAFVSISLIVSSIMIGVITYISVLERTKEIGILRAIGASKSNISSIFNAETFIIGLISGIMGIVSSLILIIPINIIIHSLTKTNNISAILPFNAAIILIILSVILTLIGGLIPSNMASKKDPVESLRTE